jgi:trafficking protein particle complex subunit 10
MRPGWYLLDEILIRSENIIFTHDPVASHASALFAEPSNRLPSADGNIGQARVLVWPQAHSLDVRLTHHNEIRLEQPRSITVEISTGWNNISQGKLLLRAGSAGLRIHTADASIFSGDSTLLDQSQIGSVCFGQVLAHSTIAMKVPYALESDLREITVKIEVSYTTAKGTFTYACTPSIPILLPLGVSVQDIFQRAALFSRFTISTVDAIPIRVTRCHLQSSADHEVSSPSLTNGALDVFARQPLSLISRIYRRPPSNAKAGGIHSMPKRLLLEVEYRCLDQDIVRSVELRLLESLQAANLHGFSRLLIPSLLRDLSSRFTVQELEISGLLREICVHRILDSHWDTISVGIEPVHRDVIATWLVRWKKVCKYYPALSSLLKFLRTTLQWRSRTMMGLQDRSTSLSRLISHIWM